MKISTKGRYALRLMIDLATYGADGPVPLKTIAGRQNISEKYLEQVISLLNKGGLVKSVRGAAGGYELLKSPEEYTVGMILRATEGPLTPVACLQDEVNTCERADYCITLPLWKSLHNAINGIVDTVHLSDLIAEEAGLDTSVTRQFKDLCDQ